MDIKREYSFAKGDYHTISSNATALRELGFPLLAGYTALEAKKVGFEQGRSHLDTTARLDTIVEEALAVIPDIMGMKVKVIDGKYIDSKEDEISANQVKRKLKNIGHLAEFMYGWDRLIGIGLIEAGEVSVEERTQYAKIKELSQGREQDRIKVAIWTMSVTSLFPLFKDLQDASR